MAFSIYAHLSSTTQPTKILETVKLEIQSITEESKDQDTPTIGALANSVVKYLQA